MGINNTMSKDAKKSPQKPQKVDEKGGVQVDDFLKITDPATGKVLVAKRG